MINTYTSYQLITRDLERSINRIEAQPVVSRETEYYLENIGSVKSIEEFVGDSRLFRYAMKAHGLEDMDYAKALMVKVLEEGIDDKGSFANKLSDKRYRDFAETFNFAAHGEETTNSARATTEVTEKYLRQTLEQDAGRQNEGVRLALYFQRKAESLTSFYEVLADSALSQVVRTALGLPASFAQADIDKQVDLFEARLDIEDFKDPEKLEVFLKRFTSLWEIENPSNSQQSSIAALFSPPAEYGISTDLLLTLAQMKK